MNRLSSGDVLCVRSSDLFRVKGGAWSWKWELVGKFAVVLCGTAIAALDEFESFAYVIVDGQLLELWVSARPERVPQALLRVR